MSGLPQVMNTYRLDGYRYMGRRWAAGTPCSLGAPPSNTPREASSCKQGRGFTSVPDNTSVAGPPHSTLCGPGGQERMSLQATRGSEEESGALGRAQVASGGEAGEPDAGGCRGGSPWLGRAQVPGSDGLSDLMVDHSGGCIGSEGAELTQTPLGRRPWLQELNRSSQHRWLGIQITRMCGLRSGDCLS